MTVKVYMESSGYAELVAVFDSEDTYNLCSEALEAAAKARGMILTESVESNPTMGYVDKADKLLGWVEHGVEVIKNEYPEEQWADYKVPDMLALINQVKGV
jgi:hypothetical protein